MGQLKAKSTSEDEIRLGIIKFGQKPFSLRKMWRALVDHGCVISYDRLADTVSAMVREDQIERLSGLYHPEYQATNRPRKERLPVTAGSVVWYSGHPWVLDGEPGEPGEVWVGLGRSGRPTTMSSYEMALHHPGVIFQAP